MTKLLLSLFAFALLTVSQASAQSPDPRDYEIAYFVPSKTTIINTYLRHQSGTKTRDYSADVAVFRATYILKFGNWVITPFDALLPVIDQRAFVPLSTPLAPFNPAFSMLPSDFKTTLHATGVGDLVFLPTIGHGFESDAATKTHTWYALTTYITAPTGKYNPDRILNVGSNRWTINPLVVVGQRFLKAFTLEAMANIAFYTDNDEYRVSGVPALRGQNLKLKQERSMGAALHLGMDLHPLFFVTGSYLVNENGRRDFEVPTPNGGTVSRGETASNTVQTFRLNFGIRITPQTQVLFQWNEDFKGTPSAAMGRFLGLRIGHAFFTPAQAPAARVVPQDPASESKSPVSEPPAKKEPADEDSDEEDSDEEEEDE